MNFFFVFQNKSYIEERRGGYLWAPQKNNLGQTFHHWTDMTKVKKGDIIFNSYKGELVSLLIAKEDCKEHERPSGLDSLELWAKNGWIVYAEYIDLKNPIVYKEHMDKILELQDEKYAPFNKSGRGNTGYLFRVSKALANYLLGLIEQANGNILGKVANNNNEQAVHKIEKELDSPILLGKTDKELIIKARIGQSIFKKQLLAREKKCKLCGVNDERFLIASHIKKWSESNNQERLDVDNGLLLCPNHDALFDKGFITFDGTGRIRISNNLDDNLKIFLNINDSLLITMNESQAHYMKWHRENRFQILSNFDR